MRSILPLAPAHLSLVTTAPEVRPGLCAVGARSGRAPEALGGGRLTEALELEFLAEVGSLIHPNRVVVEMGELRFFSPLPDEEDARILARAEKREDGDILVSESVDLGARSGELRAEARIKLEDAYPLAPVVVARAERLAAYETHNADEVYAAAQPLLGEVSPQLRVLRWTRMPGHGRLWGEIRHRDHTLGVSTGGRLLAAPIALHGALQLAGWLWCALSGERATVAEILRLRQFRMPRREERLLAEVRLRGQVEEKVCLDGMIFGADNLPVLEIQNIRMISTSLVQPEVPAALSSGRIRNEWRNFVSVLAGLGAAP